MRDCVAAGDVDTERIEAATPAPLREQLATWRDAIDGIGDLPDGALAACMFGYSQLHGTITLELAGHLPPQLTDRSALFDLQMTQAAAAAAPAASPLTGTGPGARRRRRPAACPDRHLSAGALAADRRPVLRAGCPSRSVARPEADRIRRRRSAR